MTALGFVVLAAAGFGLHPTGVLHGDEALAREGERWLAVESTPAGDRLVPTRVRLDTVVDEIVDGPGEATGRDVVALASPGASMLLRGPGLRPGPIERGEVLPSEAAADGLSTAFRFRGVVYKLHAVCPDALPAPGASQACSMTLTGGGHAQALYGVVRWRSEGGETGYGDAGYPRLLHVADFDRDGRVDLILDTSDHYNASQPTLFLSSPATGDAPLRQVALHRSTGC